MLYISRSKTRVVTPGAGHQEIHILLADTTSAGRIETNTLPCVSVIRDPTGPGNRISQVARIAVDHESCRFPGI